MKSNLPAFKDDRLNEIVAAFAGRSKALKHKVKNIIVSREIDDGYERLNIDCKTYMSPPYQIRLSLWCDGGAFFRTCQSSKTGWQHNVCLSGSLGNLEPQIIEKRFEKIIHHYEHKELQELWPELSIEQ